MERAYGSVADAKSVARLRMPKPLPTHLQAFEAAHQQPRSVPTPSARPETTRDDDNDDNSAGDNDNDDTFHTDMMQAMHAQWQLDEHDRFVQALEAFGRDRSGDEWLKIAAFVRTRSPEEVRHHGRWYLHQLVQVHQFTGPSSLEYAAGSDRDRDHDNQNDPNVQNHMLFDDDDATAGGDRYHRYFRQGSGKSAVKGLGLRSFSDPSPAPLLSPNDDTMLLQSFGPRRSGRKAKAWTFEEDKIFENALANWSSDKPYSWPKIATALPGKTAKDARSRYEKLVGDVAIIETTSSDNELSRRTYTYRSTDHSPAFAHVRHGSSLSDRIAPPPPIHVSSAANDGARGSVQ